MSQFREKWTDRLDDEDLAFVKRFVIASGSLKEIARVYGVSYPTVRLRLDRLIAKIKVLDEMSEAGVFEQVLRMKAAEGKLDVDTMKDLLKAHREEKEPEKEKRS